MISPLVLFRKHTDLAVFGSAMAISHEFSDTLNGVGSGRAVFNGEDLQNVKWVQSVLSINENAYVWNRPTVVTVQDESARRFSWVVEGVECSRSDNVWLGTITLSGRGIGSCLDYATVQQLVLGGSKLFVATPRASVFKTLFDAAKARTCMPYATLSFTPTVDTTAQAWVDADNVRIRDGGTLLQLLETWSDTTWDWNMRQDGTLDVWLRAGATTTRQLNPLIHGAGASAGTETIDMRSLFTAAFGEVGASSGGVGASSAIGAKVARYGQRESYQSLGGVDEMSQISALGAIADASSIFTNSRTFTIDPTIVGSRPYLDFQLGDTIKIVAQSLKDYNGTTVTVSTARVLGWGWRIAADGTQQCDLVLDTILQHKRRFFVSEQAISQGETPVVNLTAATVSTFDGRQTGSEPTNPSILLGPINPGWIAFVQSNAGV